MQEYFSLIKIDKKGNRKYLSFKDFRPALGICKIVFTKDERKKYKFTNEQMQMLHLMSRFLEKHFKELYVEIQVPPIWPKPNVGVGKSSIRKNKKSAT